MSNSKRNGFTLVEMLVVVAIMLILIVAGLTTFSTSSDARRVREAARMLNVYLSSAKNRAKETGRPCGVTLRRFGNTSAVMTADQCEVPPAYGGDVTNAKVQVCVIDRTSTQVTVLAVVSASGSFSKSIISVNDEVQFNYQGHRYTITAVGDDYFVCTLDVSQGQMVPWPTVSAWNAATEYHKGDVVYYNNRYYACIKDGTDKDADGNSQKNIGKVPSSSPEFWSLTTLGQSVAYSIYRAPVKNGATPLQLPAGAVVDLGGSGIDNSGVFSNYANDVTILFDADEAIRLSVAGAVIRVTEPIFLLVGKRERVGSAYIKPSTPLPTPAPNPPTVKTESQFTNVEDLNCLWVMVNPQSGLVLTGNNCESETAAYNAYMASWNNPATKNDKDKAYNAAFYAALYTSRALARNVQGVGGK